MAAVIQGSTSYTITYKDCNNPTTTSEISLENACTNEEAIEIKKQTYTVLQKRGVEHLDGYSCSVTISEFEEYCGAFSHMKMIQPPNIEVPEPITPEVCRSLRNHGLYRTKYGTTHRVDYNSETIFTATEKGVVKADGGNIYCKGEELRFNNEIIEGVIIMSQYKVRIVPEVFIIDQQRVETLDEHLKLPRECAPETGSCVADKRTYIWNHKRRCPFVKIRQVRLEKENDYLIDHDQKLLFKKEDKAQLPDPCPPQGSLYFTEYSELYLTEESEFDVVDEIDIALFVRARDDYISWQFERKTRQLSETIAQEMCRGKYDNLGSNIIPITKDHFGRRNGDILYTFNCPEKVAKVASLEQCHSQFPILVEDTVKFVSPTTRILSDHDQPIPCPPINFAMTVKSVEGKWITINPEVKVRAPPAEGSLTDYDQQQHEDMSTGGLYTDQEIKKWENMIQWSTFRESVAEHLAQGVCKTSECNDQEYENIPGPGYDLSNLVRESEGLSPFAVLTKFMDRNLVYIAMIIIAKWTLDMMITTTLIVLTITKDGTVAALNFIYRISLPTVYQHEKLRKRQMRSDQRASRDKSEVHPLQQVFSPTQQH